MAAATNRDPSRTRTQRCKHRPLRSRTATRRGRAPPSTTQPASIMHAQCHMSLAHIEVPSAEHAAVVFSREDGCQEVSTSAAQVAQNSAWEFWALEFGRVFLGHTKKAPAVTLRWCVPSPLPRCLAAPPARAVCVAFGCACLLWRATACERACRGSVFFAAPFAGGSAGHPGVAATA
jgi:hypothetical protein